MFFKKASREMRERIKIAVVGIGGVGDISEGSWPMLFKIKPGHWRRSILLLVASTLKPSRKRVSS